MEKAKTVRLNVNQNRARQVGLSSKAISNQLYAVLSGAEVTQIRDGIYLVDVVGRAANIDKMSLETLRQLQLNLPSGASVPLSDVADIDYTIDKSATVLKLLFLPALYVVWFRVRPPDASAPPTQRA